MKEYQFADRVFGIIRDVGPSVRFQQIFTEMRFVKRPDNLGVVSAITAIADEGRIDDETAGQLLIHEQFPG